MTAVGVQRSFAGDECSAYSGPSAAFSVSCSTVDTCRFTSTSSDDIGVWAQDWDFGDGASAANQSMVDHTFPAEGVYLVTLTVTDTDMQLATVVKSVQVGDAVPLATDDEFFADTDKLLTITFSELLANDAPGVQFLQILEQPLRGYPITPGATSLIYRSGPGYQGPDEFVYAVRDAAGHIGQATVRVSVSKAPPVANPDSLSTTVGVPVEFTDADLLANDSTGAVFGGFSNVQHGTITFVEQLPSGAKKYRFTPAPGFAGTGVIEYMISWDGLAPYEYGLVYVTVEDAPPQAIFYLSCVNRTCTVVSDTGDDVGIADEYWQWGDGQSIHSTADTLTHTYAQSGFYTVSLTVTDTAGHSTTVTKDALANTKPVATNDAATTERDIAVTIAVLANDSDADGDPLNISNVTVNHTGAVVNTIQQGNSYALRVTPPDSFVGTLTITYKVYDQWQGISAPATVTVTVVQWSSVMDALGEQFYCAQNGQIPIARATLLSNDYDSNGDTLSILSFDTTVLSGTLDCATDPLRCWYRPPVSMAGFTFFRYTASDPAGHRDIATVKIYVGILGNAPTASNDLFTTTRNTPRAFTIQELVQNDNDPNGDTLSVNVGSGARDYGTLSCTSPMYQCTYTPNAGFIGPDRFQYTATDGLNPTSTAYINMLTLPPTTPTFDAREDLVSTAKNQQAYWPNALLTSNDYDPERDPITISSVDKAGLSGSMTCNTAGCTYTPPANYVGTTKFKYTATDNHGSTDVAFVRVRVGQTNTPPVASSDAFSTPKNTVLKFSIFDLMRNDYDANNDPMNVTVSTSMATKGSLNCGTLPHYWCTYTPNANVTGTDTINYSLSDGSAASSSFTITITP